MADVHEWVEREFSIICEELFSFLRFKTISADPSFSKEHPLCCKWLCERFNEMEFHAKIIETSGKPIVYAEHLQAGPDAPTLLIYGHYDVQPIDPIELWKSDPFEPVIREGQVYARGALDDKGQIYYAVVAARALLSLNGALPVNLKFCIEGEEECGSEGLLHALDSLKETFRADCLLVVDCGLPDAKTPAIDLGGRGIITLDVTVTGSKEDLHSGLFGGIAYNPNRALAELISQCWDENGSVAVPHFYDDVIELGNEEKREFAKAFNEQGIEDAGIVARSGEEGKSSLEANWLRPTLEINGMAGGYAGAGFKTVIPSQARAKISCRLVPNQDPHKIGALVADFLRAKVKEGIEIQVDVLHGGRPFRGSADSLLARAMAKAYEKMFQKPCLKVLSGGSIPIVADLSDAIGAEVVGMGYGLAGDYMHAPNEHFGLDRFKMGILTVAKGLEFMRELP